MPAAVGEAVRYGDGSGVLSPEVAGLVLVVLGLVLILLSVVALVLGSFDSANRKELAPEYHSHLGKRPKWMPR